MRVNAIGVQRLKGVSKTGSPFDFARVMFLRPVEVTSGEKFTSQGFGFMQGEIDLSIDALHKFNDVKFPAMLDLALEQVPDRRGVKSVCVGFAPQVRAAQAA